METTFEEARRCPKCSSPGEEQKNEIRSGPNGSKIHVMRCMNERCSWFDTDWIVQVNSDGMVPIREGSQQKTFPPIPGMTTEKAREQITNIQDENRRRR